MKAVVIALMLLTVGFAAVTVAAPTASACVIPDDPVDCVRRPVNFLLDLVDCRVFGNC